MYERFFLLGMIGLFLIFIYKPALLRIFENSFLRKNGEASYFLYLIHENIGVFIICGLGHYFMPFGFMLTLLLMLLFSFFSVFCYQHIDIKISKYLKLKFFKK